MQGKLAKGKIIKSENGLEYIISKFIGGGGQGEVYAVKSGKDQFALKWYHPSFASENQKDIIQRLIIKGSPDPCFLWPIEFVQDQSSFGYIMDLRSPAYNSLIDLLKRRVFPSLKTLCISGFNTARGFRMLHSDGWCYGDINWGNLFIDFSNGKVLICDNDNVVPNQYGSTINGTLGFMAPEIVDGTGRPSINTDLFSLSVLLFYLFNIHHPLEGKLEADIHAWDGAAKCKIYGKEAVFIWNPLNKRNRPVPGYQQNAIDFWNLHPKFFKGLFTHAFTEGLLQPDKRSTEVEWQTACVRLMDSIIYCKNVSCGVENFYDFEVAQSGGVQTCWSCHRAIPKPLILKIDHHRIVLEKDQKIFQHHATGNFNIEEAIGAVTQKPENPTIWGIKNLSSEIWTFEKPGGKRVFVEKGKSVPLISGGKVNFGFKTAEIIT